VLELLPVEELDSKNAKREETVFPVLIEEKRE
jgi:hypothetical protein